MHCLAQSCLAGSSRSSSSDAVQLLHPHGRCLAVTNQACPARLPYLTPQVVRVGQRIATIDVRLKDAANGALVAQVRCLRPAVRPWLLIKLACLSLPIKPACLSLLIKPAVAWKAFAGMAAVCSRFPQSAAPHLTHHCAI